MEYLLVNSSKINKIGYNRNSLKMEVHFKNGHVYLHSEVPLSYYVECVVANSIGKYYFNNIKEVFPYQIIA